MKRTILLFALLFYFMGAYADNLSEAVNSFGKTLTAVIAKETNGYITEETANEYCYSTTINVPEYYDNELIILTLSQIIEDAEFVTNKPWTAVEDGIISEYHLGDSAIINFRFDFISHHLMTLIRPIRD